MNKPLHYIVLFFIITFAVMSGNLLSNYMSLWVTALAAEEIVKQQKAINIKNNQIRNARQENNKIIQEQIAAQKTDRDKTTRQRNSIGKALERTCVDWVNMAKTTPTRTTLEGRKKHCANYNNYIDTGRYKKY